jgi:type IV pilus assembly protein PilO
MANLNIAEKIEPIISKIGELTKVQRYAIYIGTVGVIVGAFLYVFYFPLHQEIQDLKTERDSLLKKVASTKKKALKLPAYKKKIKAAQVEFEIVKNTLPDKKDIPALLTSVSRAGRDAGLEFDLFQPKNDVVKDFYAEIPVSIKVKGGYHNVAMFFDKVSRLSRIVNMRNIKMSGQGNQLKTSCEAVTYRFLDASQIKKKKKKKKGRRR